MWVVDEEVKASSTTIKLPLIFLCMHRKRKRKRKRKWKWKGRKEREREREREERGSEEAFVRILPKAYYYCMQCTSYISYHTITGSYQ